MGMSCLYTSGFNNPTLVPASTWTCAHCRQWTAGQVYVTRTRVASSHSNHKIQKLNRRSRYGKPLSTYDADEDDAGGGLDEGDELFSEDDFGDIEISGVDRRRLNLKNLSREGQGSLRQGAKGWNIKPSQENAQRSLYRVDRDGSCNASMKRVAGTSSSENKFHRLSEEIGLDERYFPLLNYLDTFGFEESHFIRMYERHMPSLQINVESARERLDYLLSVGVKHGDMRKILSRQPQILEYTVENNLKSHVSFLVGLGIPESKIGRIIAATPSIFSYSVENSLKSTVKYLTDEVGIHPRDLSKVVRLSPQILVQRIDVSWSGLLSFLTTELSAPRQSIVKMVIKHPQTLHYSIDKGLLPRIDFLRSIGMHNSDILKILTSLTQVLSLSVERNLKPKYAYLVGELRNEVRSLTKYPTYLSLSLDRRIRPRHQFLVSLKRAPPKGPFPLSSFVPTDEFFCRKWAGTSLDQYVEFRQRLLLKEFSKKYERR